MQIKERSAASYYSHLEVIARLVCLLDVAVFVTEVVVVVVTAQKYAYFSEIIQLCE